MQVDAPGPDQNPTAQLAQLAWNGVAVNMVPLCVPPWHWMPTDDAEPAAHPEAQESHCTSALGENLPWPHGTHVVVPPTAKDTVPGVHGAQEAAEFALGGDV